MKLATAGQWVNRARHAMAGSRSSQPWIVAVARFVIGFRISDRP